MKKSLDNLKLVVNNLYSMSLEEWEDFSSIWHPVCFQKKDIISKPQAIENYYYFNVVGLQRLVYSDESGKETTIELTYETCFGGNLTSFLLRKPASTSYMAITKSELLRCSYLDLINVLDKHKGLDRFFRIILAQTMDNFIEHLIVVKSYSSISKYNSILLNAKLNTQRVPQKYLASHLGLDASNYSKIKKQTYGRLK